MVSLHGAAESPVADRVEELKLYFTHLFTNSRDMMNLFSLTQGRVIMLNTAAEQCTGYTLAELAELPIETLYPASEMPKLALAFDRLRATGYSSEKLAMYVKSGELRDIWTRSYVIQNEPECVCLVHTIDVTEENRKQERELRNARLATLGESSATMAHELKNALQSMQFNLAALRGRLADDPTSRTQTVLKRLERAASHMDDVISGIQKFARGSKHSGAYISLPSSVDAALTLMEGYIRTKGVQTSCAFEPSLPAVWSDRAQVEQILVILIKNAVQAMDGRAERRLRISVSSQPHDGARIDIDDTGGGLSEEILPRVFESFATTKPVGVGIGLGLATAKQLAANNGIDLTFQSTAGVGATFSLSFPVSRAVERDPTLGSELAGRTILLVGDDASVLDHVTAALLQAGARTLVATSASEATQLLRVHSVEAVVCDESMYPVDAKAFLTTARTVYRGPVCLLAEPRSSGMVEGLSVSCVIWKPIDIEELVRAIGSFI